MQSAGSPDAGTGLEKSSIIQKISLAEAEALRNGSHTQSQVDIAVVDSEPQVINPNGTRQYYPCTSKLTIGQVEQTTKAKLYLQVKDKEKTSLQLYT